MLHTKGNLMLQPSVIVVCDDDTKLADSRHVTAYAVIQSELIYTFNSALKLSTCVQKMHLHLVYSFRLLLMVLVFFFTTSNVQYIFTKFDRQCGKVKQLLIHTK